MSKGKVTPKQAYVALSGFQRKIFNVARLAKIIVIRSFEINNY
jgi:hypothetical protein